MARRGGRPCSTRRSRSRRPTLRTSSPTGIFSIWTTGCPKQREGGVTPQHCQQRGRGGLDFGPAEGQHSRCPEVPARRGLGDQGALSRRVRDDGQRAHGPRLPRRPQDRMVVGTRGSERPRGLRSPLDRGGVEDDLAAVVVPAAGELASPWTTATIWLLRSPYAQRRALVDASRELGLEGVVLKRLSCVYQPGQRSGDWVKIRHLAAADVLIGGWLPRARPRSHLAGSVLVGAPGSDGLDYLGRSAPGSPRQSSATLPPGSWPLSGRTRRSPSLCLLTLLAGPAGPARFWRPRSTTLRSPGRAYEAHRLARAAPGVISRSPVIGRDSCRFGAKSATGNV